MKLSEELRSGSVATPEQIERAKSELKCNNSEFAEKLHVSAGTVSRWLSEDEGARRACQGPVVALLVRVLQDAGL